MVEADSKQAATDMIRELERQLHQKEAEIAMLREITTVIGGETNLQKVFNLVEKVIDNTTSVLIQGETGTGKQLTARIIHDLSPRRQNRFMAVNCGSFKNDLLIEELFRPRNRMFTGDVQNKGTGPHSDEEGTLLLDQIEDLSGKFPNMYFLLGGATGLAGGVVDVLSQMRDAGEIGNTVAMVNVADAFGIELAEAARVDGAGPMRFFLDILVPMSRTNMAALFVILFIYGWNQYLWPFLITTDQDLYTIVMGIQRMVKAG